MKLNKTLALVALVGGGLLAGTALQAQDSTNTPPAGEHHGGPGMRKAPNIDQMVDKMAKDLNLTDDQKVKVKAVMEDQMAKAKELRENTTLSPEEKRTKMKEMREAHIAKMKEILTAEQFEKWQKHAQQRPRGPQGHGDKPAPGGDNPPKQN